MTVKGRDRTYTVPKIPRAQPVRFGTGIRLLGYGLIKQDTPGGGAAVHLTLYLQALATMDRSYTVFTHLLDSQSRTWAQEDATPLHGAASTTTWLAGEVITDEFVLVTKPGAPPGEYDEIGFYDSGSLQRLAVFDDGGSVLGDRVLLLDKVRLGPRDNRKLSADATRRRARPSSSAWLLAHVGSSFLGAMTRCVLAIDIGATRVRVAVIEENGTILWREPAHSGKRRPDRDAGAHRRCHASSLGIHGRKPSHRHWHWRARPFGPLARGHLRPA